MALNTLCVENLNVAINLNGVLKALIIQNKPKQAIDIIADILFVLGQTLQCINRVEFNQMVGSYKPSFTAKRSMKTYKITNSNKKLCLQLVDTATANFIQAKRLILQNKLEDAENIIAATISGRILRCVNSLR